jgi:uncharacterized protein (TIGR00369 family)
VPEMMPRDPEFRERVAESFARQALMRTLGARLAEVAPGEVVIEVEHRPELTQQNGYLHAGVLASIADSACGYAAFTLMPPGSNVLSVEFKLNLLAPAAGPRTVARARVIRAGGTLSVCTADVLSISADGAETPVAFMLATLIRR